jgi:transcription elongation factor Elf1
MTDRTPCQRCGKIGFVRLEHVIDHGKSTTLFYCGSCNQRWEVLDEERHGPADARATVDERRRTIGDRRRSTRRDRRRS